MMDWLGQTATLGDVYIVVLGALLGSAAYRSYREKGPRR